MKRHKHADLIAKWVEDTSQEVEFYEEELEEWMLCKRPAWFEHIEYRIKPKTMKIGDFEINKPEQDAPSYNTLYYVPFFGNEGKYFDGVWCGSDYDYQMLKWNLVHLNKEAAIQHTNALIHVSKGII